MLCPTSFHAAAICFTAIMADPTHDALYKWYAAEVERARVLSNSLSERPVHVVWSRKDTYTHTAAELAELRSSAERHPQSRAQHFLKRTETSNQLGGLTGEHRLWFGKSGFRHNLNTLYNEPGSFVDVALNISKGSGWSLTESALNQVLTKIAQGSGARTTESFKIGFVQDLLPSFSGGFSELSRRTFEHPTASMAGNRFTLDCPSPSDKFVSGALLSGVWDAPSSSGRVDSLRLKSRRGSTDDQTFTFNEWADASGVTFARQAVRSMPSINTFITIKIDSVEFVDEDDVRRVIEEPMSLDGGSAYRDAVRGSISLGSRTSFTSDTPLTERLNDNGAVRVNLPDPRRHDVVLRVWGWILGGGLLTALVAYVLWKRRV